MPIAPTLMRLLGAAAPRTEAGTIAGKPAASTAEPPRPFAAAASASRRVIPFTRVMTWLLSGSVTLCAAACAFRTISAARKQCACGIAVSVRSRTSETSRGP